MTIMGTKIRPSNKIRLHEEQNLVEQILITWKEQNFSVRGTSQNKKVYLWKKTLASAEQIGPKKRLHVEVHPAVIDLRTNRTPVIWVAGCSTRWWGTGARNKLKTEEGIPTASVHQFHQPIEKVQLSADVRPSYADIKSCNLVSCKIRGLSCPAQSFKREREHCNAIMLNLQRNSYCWVLTL
jgi:hypothetical protein